MNEGRRLAAGVAAVLGNAMKSDHVVPDRDHQAESAGGDHLEIRVGLRIRHARLNRGLRLREMAEQVGCSESLLSKIENDKLLPSLNVLHRISERLGLTVGQLLSKANEPQRIVSRAGERPMVNIDPLRRGYGLVMERLIPYHPSHLLQASIHVVEPDGGSLGRRKLARYREHSTGHRPGSYQAATIPTGLHGRGSRQIPQERRWLGRSQDQGRHSPRPPEALGCSPALPF